MYVYVSITEYLLIPVFLTDFNGMNGIEFVHTIRNPTSNGKIKVYYTF